MKKMLLTLAGAALLTVAMASTAFAGVWKQDSKGWWYQRNDGTYPVNQWEWIDGDHDSYYESYYFDSNGYCLMNTTTPDGYQVNENGAWIENGKAKTKQIATYLDLDTSNHINYSLTRYTNMISRNISPTYLCIYDSDGNPLAYSYRNQVGFSPDEGNGYAEVENLVRLEKEKEYYIEAIVSAYSRLGLKLSWPRLVDAYVTSMYDPTVAREHYYDLDIDSLTPINNIEQHFLKDKQVVEGSINGAVLENGNKKLERFYGYTRGQQSEYTYTGVCFRSGKFRITDDMPNEGYIKVITPIYYNFSDSNENIVDDILAIHYVIEDTEADKYKTKNDFEILPAVYDERGINQTMLNMLHSTKEQNAENHRVFTSYSYDSSDPYNPDVWGTREDIIYENGVSVSYDIWNRPVKVSASSTTPDNHVYKYAPDGNEFPLKTNDLEIDKMLRQYGESIGFMFDDYSWFRTDGVKTFDVNPTYGNVYLYFNNEDRVSLTISGVAKQSDYRLSLCKTYPNE